MKLNELTNEELMAINGGSITSDIGYGLGMIAADFLRRIDRVVNDDSKKQEKQKSAL
jgi:lactobin A/cerein 7B family class IIb bacteriocin